MGEIQAQDDLDFYLIYSSITESQTRSSIQKTQGIGRPPNRMLLAIDVSSHQYLPSHIAMIVDSEYIIMKGINIPVIINFGIFPVDASPCQSILLRAAGLMEGYYLHSTVCPSFVIQRNELCCATESYQDHSMKMRRLSTREVNLACRTCEYTVIEQVVPMHKNETHQRLRSESFGFITHSSLYR
jgi:hypothetical protein